MKKILALFLLFGCLFGCVQDDPVPPSRKSELPVIRPSLPGDIIAWQISMNVSEPGFRLFLKDRILKKFDGDYNFLFTMHSADQLENGSSLLETLDAGLEKGTISTMLSNEPQLQIAMPDLSSHSPETWDTEKEIPIVVYRAPDLDLRTQRTVTAYRLGKPVALSLDKEPDERLLVVSHNERTLLVPKNKQIAEFSRQSGYGTPCDDTTPVYEDNSYSYYLKNELQDCTTPITGSATSGNGCQRDKRSTKDQVIGARFTTMNYMREAEHYLDGNPEVYFIVTLASKNPSGFSSLRKSYPSVDRSQWKNCGILSCVPEWHDRVQPVFKWDPDTFGSLVRYDWFEEDFSAGKVEITLGLTSKFEKVAVSGNVKITINKKDYFLDQDFVNYCDIADGRGSEYNTGKLLFKINHR